jgi:hypothetical protein
MFRYEQISRNLTYESFCSAYNTYLRYLRKLFTKFREMLFTAKLLRAWIQILIRTI